MSSLDVPVRDDDILVNPYALTEDLLPASKLLEEHLFASDNNAFKRLLSEVSLKCIGMVPWSFQHKLHGLVVILHGGIIMPPALFELTFALYMTIIWLYINKSDSYFFMQTNPMDSYSHELQ